MTRCALTAVSEPLLGTATQALRWILVEHPGPWPRDALTSPGVDPQLREWNALPGTRVQLVRHPDRKGAHERVWLFDAHNHHLYMGGTDLLDQVAGWLDGRPLKADVSPDMLFVCAHAKRDQCCAIDGRAYVSAAHSDYVWESSHLGGHRFAATALLAPHGVQLGRLTDPAVALTVRNICDHLRGDVRFGAAEQVAAGLAMRHWGCSPRDITSVAAIARSPKASDDVYTFEYRVSGASEELVVAVTESQGTERLESCGAEPTAGLWLRGRIVSACD